MIKRLLVAVFLFCAFQATAFGQGLPLISDLDSQLVQVEGWSNMTVGTLITDPSTFAPITITLVKHDGTVTSFVAGSGAGDHNFNTTPANSMTMPFRLDLTDVDQPGNLHFSATAAGMIPFTRAFTIIDPNAEQINILGVTLTAEAIRTEMDANSTKLALLGIGVRTIQKGVAYTNAYVTFFNTDGTRKTDLTAGDISCNVSLDGAAANAIDDDQTELSDVDFPGVWVFDLTGAETNGNSAMVLCKTTGGLYAGFTFQTQR